jgi:hypothetical protein
MTITVIIINIILPMADIFHELSQRERQQHRKRADSQRRWSDEPGHSTTDAHVAFGRRLRSLATLSGSCNLPDTYKHAWQVWRLFRTNRAMIDRRCAPVAACRLVKNLSAYHVVQNIVDQVMYENNDRYKVIMYADCLQQWMECPSCRAQLQ